LGRFTATGGIDGKQNRPCDAATSETYQDDELEEPEKEIAVE
jgi:hypothetical protein